VTHKYTLGDTSTPTFCVRYCWNDKYIATGCGDGSIKIFNVFTGKQSYTLNTDLDEPMPTTQVRWRPLNAPGITKNVIIATNANGTLYHYHTTSGKKLNQIYDPLNALLTADYKPDGLEFLTAGSDTVIRVYDEQTRQEKCKMDGGSNGEPGHSNRIFCAKWDKENTNLVVSGGWDKSIKIWDIRTPQVSVRGFMGPYICGDSIDIHDSFILTGQNTPSNQLQMWDFGTQMPVTDIPFDESLPSQKPCQVYCCQFQKETGDLIIAGGSGSNEVKVFDGN